MLALLIISLLPAYTFTITVPQPVTIAAEVTRYSSIDSCHTGPDCLMANGERAYVGAAACPRWMALGTQIVIDEVGYTCADRTALRYDGRFDLFTGYGVDAYMTAMIYGIQQKEVTIK